MSLIYFIGGLFTAMFVLPIIQSIADIICSFFEVVKSNMSVEVTKNNCEIAKLNMETEPSCTQAIGFQVSSESEFDEEDCGMKSSKRVVGFTGGANE